MTWMTLRPNRNLPQDQLAHLFDDMFQFPARCHVGENFRPAVDLTETDNEIKLTLEVPGFDKKDIKVTIKDRLLTIEGKREIASEVKGRNEILSEIQTGSFVRSFTLPDTVNSEKITADQSNGLLQITLAKIEEVKPKEIEVSIK